MTNAPNRVNPRTTDPKRCGWIPASNPRQARPPAVATAQAESVSRIARTVVGAGTVPMIASAAARTAVPTVAPASSVSHPVRIAARPYATVSAPGSSARPPSRRLSAVA